ncbi:MAG: hypothetical protein LBF22_11520, partial [Deltaproteobacteria bacterium]|nr:hypothetical protein [Deltaproteobacteria bacterium]
MKNTLKHPKSHFVSFVGESATSTLIPYLGYLEKFGDPISIVLLRNPRVEEWVPPLKKHIQKISPAVPIKEVEIAVDGHIPKLKKVEDVYRELEESLETLAINMMGGMKKSSLSGLFALKKRNHIFLQLSEEKFLVSRFVGDTIHTETDVLETTVPVEVYLSLQKIDFTHDPDPPWDLKHLCHKHQIPVPENAMFNVKIAGQRIDCIWNAGNNTLNFLIIPPPSKLHSPDALASARKIEALAATKWWTNGLFSRHLFIFESVPYNVNRYQNELRSLVKPYVVDWRADKILPETKEYLNEIFKPFKPNTHKIVVKKPTWKPSHIKTLITSMGRLSDATLLAIASHKCPQVVLLYTPEDEWVSHMVKIYEEKARDLGLQSLLTLETDYTAANVHSHLPAELAPISVVNITPGTKPQGTALALWAKNHGVQAWALDREVIYSLGEKRIEKPVLGLTLKNRLFFSLEIPVTKYGWNKHSPDWSEDNFFEEMLNFMRLVIQAGLTDKFLKEDIFLDGYKIIKDFQKNLWTFYWDESKTNSTRFTRRLTLKGGYWYEKITAKAIDALNQFGNVIYDVSCGVEVT